MRVFSYPYRPGMSNGIPDDALHYFVSYARNFAMSGRSKYSPSSLRGGYDRSQARTGSRSFRRNILRFAGPRAGGAEECAAFRRSRFVLLPQVRVRLTRHSRALPHERKNNAGAKSTCCAAGNSQGRDAGTRAGLINGFVTRRLQIPPAEAAVETIYETSSIQFSHRASRSGGEIPPRSIGHG